MIGATSSATRPTLAKVDRLAFELGPWGSLAIFASETGLRPAEWIALEWPSIDRAAGVILVERTFVRGG